GRRAPTLLLVAAATTLATSARAGTFGLDGTFFFDPTAVARFDFEDPAEAQMGIVPLADAHALSGSNVVPVPPMQGANLTVKLPPARGTYRVSLWLRGAEVIGDVEISYGDRVSEIAALYPTGRVTSDGWIEVANDHIRVDGPRLKLFQIGLFAASG